MGRKAGLLIVLGFFLLCFGTPPVYGKGYPEKDIKIYIPVGPGGSMDFMTRGAATFLEKSLKVRIFMENTSGSSGGIAYNRVYKMKPDGYNLVVFGLPTLLLTSLNQQVAFKAEEFSPIFGWVADQQILFVHSDSWKTFDEFVTSGRKEPIVVGVTGIMSASHLATVVMAETLKVKIRFVSYPGGGDMMAALAGKHIQAVVTLPLTALGLARAGKVRGLLTFGTEKSTAFPEVPNPKSAGHDFTTVPWLLGIMGPPKLPDAVVTVLESAFKKMLEEPKYHEFAAERKINTISIPSKQLGEEIKRQSKIIVTHEKYLKESK
jgi:tripartite-type tricarboxylate transporter receptor subunit TctC